VSETPLPWFYDRMASWWPLLSAVEEYAEEAGFYGRVLTSAGTRPAHTLLELGSGGGNNAFFLKRRFQSATLVDPASGMLDVSRAVNPDCDHVQGDMRTVRLNRQFDRVFVHDAVVYMISEQDLHAAIETAYVHCRPGGAALFAPDYVKETFRPGTDHGGHDDGARGLRFLEWVSDPDPTDATYTVDYAFLMRDADGQITVAHDRHIEGLFARGDWLRILREVGFEPSVMPLEHSEVEPDVHEVFVGVRLK
jgi:trans-aconitate methyltransferase